MLFVLLCLSCGVVDGCYSPFLCLFVVAGMVVCVSLFVVDVECCSLSGAAGCCCGCCLLIVILGFVVVVNCALPSAVVRCCVCLLL